MGVVYTDGDDDVDRARDDVICDNWIGSKGKDGNDVKCENACPCDCDCVFVIVLVCG